MPYGARHIRPGANRPGATGSSKPRGTWWCAKCSSLTVKVGCGRQGCDPHYFASRMEMRRAAQLVLLRDQGKIEALEFHPRYELRVNGKLWRTYVADFRYVDVERARRRVIEDCKYKGWEEFDESAKQRIDLFRILYPEVTLNVVIM